jgi:hypothetical protein
MRPSLNSGGFLFYDVFINMGKRLIITEEEKTYIRQSYGLVTEGLDKEKTATLRNNFLGKTINVYNDLQQQNLYGMLRIDGIVFRDPELNSGRVKMDLSDGVTTSQFEIHCLANPDRLSNEMDMYQGTTNKGSFYNKQFTDKLLSLSNGWCKKPSADFAKTNTTPNTTA